MEDRVESLSDVDLTEALRLGGWMLAHQALAAASGEMPGPLIAFAHDDLVSPQLLVPKTGSDLYDAKVSAGRALITDISSQARHWIYSYDQDLEDSGRVLVVEVGTGKPLQRITFGQRYTYSEEAGLRLIGDLELVGRELLPTIVQESLELFRWHYLITEGAASHDVAGKQWSAWYSARDHQQAQLQLGEFSLAVPGGWFFRRTQDDKGWVITRLLPWEYWEFEPTIIAMLVTYRGQATLGNVMEDQRSRVGGRGAEVLKVEIAKLPPPSLSSEAAYLAWDEEREGHCFRSEWVWVPTDEPGCFLLLCASSFNKASRETVMRALDAVLTSLGLSDSKEIARSRRAEGSAKPWIRKFLKKWRS